MVKVLYFSYSFLMYGVSSTKRKYLTFFYTLSFVAYKMINLFICHCWKVYTIYLYWLLIILHMQF